MLKIIRKEDDPLVTRISAGGALEHGTYLVYRGKITDVKRILTEILDKISLFEKDIPVDKEVTIETSAF